MGYASLFRAGSVDDLVLPKGLLECLNGIFPTNVNVCGLDLVKVDRAV